jgi:hypothetical protein
VIMIDWRPEHPDDKKRDAVFGWARGRPWLMRWDTKERRWSMCYHGAPVGDVEFVATVDPPNSAPGRP